MAPDRITPEQTALDHTTRLFFDASCLIAAAGSPSGGSGFLLALCAHKWLRGAISHYVLLEAANNIQAKFTPAALDRFYGGLQSVPFLIAPVPPLDVPARWHAAINAKDRHVIAAALALTPGDFIGTHLPTHIDYPHLR